MEEDPAYPTYIRLFVSKKYYQFYVMNNHTFLCKSLLRSLHLIQSWLYTLWKWLLWWSLIIDKWILFFDGWCLIKNEIRSRHISLSHTCTICFYVLINKRWILSRLLLWKRFEIKVLSSIVMCHASCLDIHNTFIEFLNYITWIETWVLFLLIWFSAIAIANLYI